MADPIEGQSSPQIAGAAASPVAGDAPASQPAAQPDLASLLSDFEAQTATPKAPEPPQAETLSQNPVQAAPAVDPIAAGMAGFDDLARAHALEQQVKGLTSEVEAARHYIDRQHFDGAVSAIEKRLQDYELPVPEGYVKTALMAAAHDQNIAQAFDNRGQNPAAYTRAMRKLQDKIIADVKAWPDFAATQDKAAVVHAMRGATTKEYKEPTPKYGSMTESEFKNEKAKFGL